MMAGVGAALAVAACGSGQRQDVHEPKGRFRVAVTRASFPATQKLSQHTHLVIDVQNTGTKTIPDLAVTICNVTCADPAPAGEGSSAQAFAADTSGPQTLDATDPLWVVDRGPGHCGYSCLGGGQGAYVTAYSNTWASGRLKPGRSVSFDWAVTAVSSGKHRVAWQVAAGLNGDAKAVLADGSPPRGTFAVNISSAPPKSYVNNSGQIINP
jgi:hypothetical protein